MVNQPHPREYLITWSALVLAWVALAVFWMPTMRTLAWVVLWAAYATGQTPDPPPAYTAWAP